MRERDRWGEPLPPPARPVRRGRWRFDLRGHYLDRVGFGGVDVARRIYVAVRDHRWRSVPGTVTRAEVTEEPDRTLVTLAVTHPDRFAWKGRVVVTDDALAFDVDGQVTGDFLRNRIGLCVLHPLRLAGTPVAVNGVPAGAFPERVSPWQPFTGIRTMAYQDRGLRVTLAFTGDTFETEDQRNWTDASYKTYGTPLALPAPVQVRAGEAVRQSVRVGVEGQPAPAGIPRGPDTIEVGGPAGALPALGPGPVTVDLGDPAWRNRLPAGDGAPVVSADCPPGVPGLAELAAACRDRVGTVLVFDHGAPTTSRALAALARPVLHAAGIAVGGGSRAHFAELNRAEDLPTDLLDVLAFPVAAEVHDRDRDTIRETLDSYPVLVRQARAAGAGQLLVGPVSFPPSYPDADPDSGSTMPPWPRPGSRFGAAWAVGAVAALGYAGADAVAFHRSWYADRDYPVREVLDWLGTGGVLCALRLPAGLTGLAVRRGEELSVAVANLGDQPRRLRVGGLSGWRLLGDGTETGGQLTLPAPSVAMWRGPHE